MSRNDNETFWSHTKKISCSTDLKYIALSEAELVVCCCSKIILSFSFHQVQLKCPKRLSNGRKGAKGRSESPGQVFLCREKEFVSSQLLWNLQFVKGKKLWLKDGASNCILDKNLISDSRDTSLSPRITLQMR